MKKAGILFFILILSITAGLKIEFLLSPVDPTDNQEIFIKIQSGSNSGDISNLLEEKDLIKSDVFFNFWVSILGLDDRLQAGYYKFSRSNNLLEILDNLIQGKIVTYRLTIPEGYELEQIISRLANMTSYSQERLLKEAQSEKYLGFLNINLNKNKVKYTVEGFLYPDTYIIPFDFTPEQIYKVILNQFKSKWWVKLNENHDKEFTAFQIITIASLIEKEAKLKQEQPLVAAVIYNRLKQDMLLQIDASVQYVFEQRKQTVLYEDLNIDSLYNTYLYQGLPPGPICSPGDDAIEAALNPAEVDYLFYFALSDGSHVFTKTYQKHLEKQSQIENEGK